MPPRKAAPSIGDDVFVTNKNLPARVRYVGRTNFAKGVWIGVELTGAEDQGKNSGIVKGEKYFTCPRFSISTHH